jgi:hypothetical protein
MKTLPPSRSRPNWLHRLIHDATGAPAKDLARIENIMRDEIFHSTPDWQTRKQLTDAARQAFARLNEDREMYDLDHACRIAMFHKMRAESGRREQNTPANRAAVVAADANYQSAKTKLFARLDETETT